MKIRVYKCPFCSTKAPLQMLKGHIETAHKYMLKAMHIKLFP